MKDWGTLGWAVVGVLVVVVLGLCAWAVWFGNGMW